MLLTTSERFRKHLAKCLQVSLLTSLIFSLVVFIRLTWKLTLQQYHIVLYDIYHISLHFVLPLAIVFIAITQSNLLKKVRSKATLWHISGLILGLILLTTSLLWWIKLAYTCPFYVDLLVSFSLLFFLIFLTSHMLKIRLGSRFAVFVVFAIVFSFVAPYASARLSFAHIISTIGKSENQWEEAARVSEYIRSITISFWDFHGEERDYVRWHRARNMFGFDIQKYLVVGVGGCEEMAHATKRFLDYLDINSHVASFPGEDHAFVEVRLDNTWLVLDPGYRLNLITREERGQKRLEEIGGLSYVVAYIDQDTVEITQKYVPTDKIVIKITDNGMPVANAKIVLSHMFMGKTESLPALYSDSDGVVELNLGPMSYNSRVEPVEPYYWIIVNEENTGCKVQSTGSGKTANVEIDLANV